MDISTFLTQQIETGAGKAQAVKDTAGVFAFAPGSGFLDMLLGLPVTGDKKAVEDEAESGIKGKAAASKGEGVAPKKDILPAVEKLLQKLKAEKGLTAEELALIKSGEALPAELAQKLGLEEGQSIKDISVSVAANPFAPEKADPETVPVSERRKFKEFLDYLLQGMPAESRPDVMDIPPGLMRKIMKNLNFNPAKEAQIPTLIAADLTPEELAKMLEQIREETEQGEALIVGLVKILPPESRREAIFVPRAVIVPRQMSGETEKPKTGEIASRLNSLIAGGEAPSAEKAEVIARSGEVPAMKELEGLTEKGGFDRVLRMFEQARQPGVSGQEKPEIAEKILGNGNAASEKSAPTPVSLFSSLSGDVSAAFFMDTIFPEGLEWTSGAGGVQGLSLTGPAQLTSLVTQAAHAGVPHPATQMVAATIAKAVTNGETRNINIRLNPPELGRVEVRMEFDKKANTIKAHMLIEKPETYMMLQRDAHFLERALQDSGLDTGGGLSFELAQDGNLFNGEGQGGGNGGASHSGASGGEEPEGSEQIIETTVNWHVDPETGLTRYDILV